MCYTFDIMTKTNAITFRANADQEHKKGQWAYPMPEHLVACTHTESSTPWAPGVKCPSPRLPCLKYKHRVTLSVGYATTVHILRYACV